MLKLSINAPMKGRRNYRFKTNKKLKCRFPNIERGDSNDQKNM